MNYIVYDFMEYPVGKYYRDLLTIGSSSCAMFSVVVRCPKLLSRKGEKFLEGLKPHLISCIEANEWPGTQLLDSNVPLYKYHLCGDTINLILASTNELFDFMEPELPEDLCLYRENGTPWLGTIAHEGDAYLQLTDEEHHDLITSQPYFCHAIIKRVE